MSGSLFWILWGSMVVIPIMYTSKRFATTWSGANAEEGSRESMSTKEESLESTSTEEESPGSITRHSFESGGGGSSAMTHMRPRSNEVSHSVRSQTHDQEDSKAVKLTREALLRQLR